MTGGVADFLEALLEQESGISPAKAAFYRANADRPVLAYWKVEAPGRVWRRPDTGEPETERVTVREYFARIGLPNPESLTGPEALGRWRYAVINPWGYVGYQLGEALLAETGHYRFCMSKAGARGMRLPSFYSGEVPATAWARGRRTMRHTLAESGTQIIATDVNLWRGTFTGLDGIHTFADLLRPDLQEAAFRRILRHNVGQLTARLRIMGLELDRLIERAAARLQAPVTLSGCLAAAHLCGVVGLIDALARDGDRHDEAGVSLSSYLTRFSGYSLDTLAGDSP